MKKSIVLLVLVAFVLTLSAQAFGRTLEEEKQAVRDYLKVVDAKIIKYRKAGNTAKMKQLQGEKAATLRRWEKLKAEMAAPTPPPPVAVPPPPPPPVARPVAAAPAGLMGLGINTAADAGMIAGMVGLTGTVLLPDPMGLGPIVGLPANAVEWKLGAGYAQGQDKDKKDFRAPHLIVDGLINLPADMLGGIESYVGGGLNFIVGRTAGGSYGGQAYVGVKGDLGLGSKTYGQLGIGILRTGSLSPAVNSRTTGFALGVVVGQQILL